MRLPRFTTRRLMATVAVVAIACWVRIQTARWCELARLYEIKAEMFDGEDWKDRADMSPEQWAAYRRYVDEANRKGKRMLGTTLLYGPDPAQARRLVEYYGALRMKYSRAARYPWLPVPPDPPWPE